MKIQMILALSLTLSSGAAFAGTTTSKITYVQVNPAANNFVIQLESPITDRAACASDDRLIYNLNSEGGKGALELALSAKSSGSAVTISGAGNCIDNLENIAVIRYQ